jgi:hypothetical protein
MRPPEILSEAGRNLATDTSRALTLTLILAAAATALGLADGGAVSRVLAEAAQFRASGASTVVLSAEGGINGAACERLSGIDGIVHAGAVRDAPVELVLAALPGAPVPLKEVTPGFGDVLGVTPGKPEGTGVLIPEQLSVMVARGPGERLGTSAGLVAVAGVYPYPADGRSPELEYAMVTAVPAHGQGLFDQCWAEVWPTSQRTSQLLRLSLDSSVPLDTDITLSQLNPTLGAELNGTERSSSRATSGAALLSVLVGVLLGYLTVRLRRLELASARHAGIPAGAQLLQLTVETSAWTTAAVVITSPLLLHQALEVDHAAQLAVFWLELRCPLGAAAGAVLGAVVATALTSEHHLFRYFKER